MATMVERMARAIYDARNGPGATPFWRSGRMQKQAYISDALAALRELREPSDAILKAGATAPYVGGDPLSHIFTAAIDAVIAEHDVKDVPGSET